MQKLTSEQADAVRKLCDAQSAFEYWCHELTASKNRGIEAFIRADKERIVHRGKEIRELQRELGFNLKTPTGVLKAPSVTALKKKIDKLLDEVVDPFKPFEAICDERNELEAYHKKEVAKLDARVRSLVSVVTGETRKELPL